MNHTGMRRVLCAGVAWAVFVLLCGCGESNRSGGAEARKPAEAAKKMEKAFEGATDEVQESVHLVSEAMRQREYDKAVVSLEAVRSQPNLTPEQGIAIHGSVVSMERELIRGIERGDPNAKRAYELLRALKKN